ncbi:DEAD-domain-containing protein [Microthyrium microscopicum]|uniref:RNA helicase n=1 Tax=Microthyrium microscopicum TaxID=703497 RepID=A0A6A6UFF1_9PEZI|nr:DEAD-domain-containing protein [Microthyrium microscopicum]
MVKANKRKAPGSASESNTKDALPRFDPKARKRQRVALDELGWQSVEIPDNLDDYEGFFGLEEVDDVEVIKASGLISFHAKGKDGAPQPGAEDVAKEGAEDEDEWEGFSESEAEESSQEEELEEEKKPKPARVLKSNKVAKDKELGALSFEALEDEDTEEGVDVTEWHSLNLSSGILSSLSNLKFSKPTPIQKASITEIVEGHDVIGKASTGSGKTLAYGIPIVEKALQMSQTRKEKPALALIIAPTRELAHQIGVHVTALCTKGNLDGVGVATITGGLSMQKQERLLSTSQIIIGTPGRLWEVMSTSKDALHRLKEIKFLVLDEADRLLSQGHFQEVEEIINALDKSDNTDENDDEPPALRPRQTLVFSATFHKGLQQKLGAKNRTNGDLMDQKESMSYLIKKLRFRQEKPKFIDVNPISQMATGIKEGLVECGAMEKDLYLYAMLLLHPRTRTLVFTNSISAVRRLTPYLQNLGLPVAALHSSMAQKARLRAVERFTKADNSILISTDVAARGLDIPGVQLIIHYHLPRAADMYVHRSGRTARAERKGASVILCAPEEVAGVRRLIARVHATSGGTHGKAIATLDVDRRVVARLKPRATLAKQIADVGVAKVKGRSDDKFFREAAEELGVEYDSEAMENGSGRQGRGNMRKKKERENREVSKDQMAAWRAELNGLLGQRVNLGISERYIAQGVVDVEALLKGEKGDFLGSVKGLDLENL